jgi:hypothetical protein
MSNPPGYKELYKNVAWKSSEEKQAFYNKYFKNSDMEKERMREVLKNFKQTILNFIYKGKIGNGKEERPITIQDIEKKVSEE